MILSYVDRFALLRGAGVTVLEGGTERQLRSGRKRVVYVEIEPGEQKQEPEPESRLERFWNRWGDAVLACSGAAASGAVILLTGGTATVVAGVFAANSALQCGIEIGKGIDPEGWKVFEENGGDVYKGYFTVKTTMELLELLNLASGATKTALKAGTKQSISVFAKWKKTGALDKLSKAAAGKNLTRAELLREIQKVDPTYAKNLAAGGKSYVSKGQLLGQGAKSVQNAGFVNPNRYRAALLTEQAGDGITIYQGVTEFPENAGRVYHLWLVEFGASAKEGVVP